MNNSNKIISCKYQKKLAQFIRARRYLVWHINDLDNLSPESIVEHVLNYGDWNDVQKLISILGYQDIMSIFLKQISRPRNNYRPEIINYFKLYFKDKCYA